MRRPSVCVLVLGLAVGLGLAACTGAGPDAAGDGSPTPSVTPLPADVLAGVTVAIAQSRSDWADRVVQLTVTNHGAGPVDIVAAALTSGLFDGPAVPDQGRPVPVGTSRSLSVPLGAPRCGDDEGAEPAAAATVTLTLTDSAGRSSTVDLPGDDPRGHLTRIHGEDCAAAAVAAGAELSVADALVVQEVAGELLGSLDLTLTPRPGGPVVAVTGVDGTVLLAPLTGAAWSTPELTTAPPTGTPAPAPDRPGTITTSLTFRPARCDAHAVAEDKRGTFLGVHTTVDGVAQPVFYLAVTTEVRGQIHDYIGQACGWPAG
ncbi:hypothetical protein [Cellulomonas hominis]